MISSFNWISRREETKRAVRAAWPGSGAEGRGPAHRRSRDAGLRLKDATKDVDVVCRSEEDKERLLAAAKALSFQIVGPEKRHERLGVNRLAVNGRRNLDIFAERISNDFNLSGAMWQKATRIRSFGSLVFRNASVEDIFIMKLIANRPGKA